MTAKHRPTTMLYRRRPGGEINAHAWNLPLDTLAVDDEAVAAHQAKGWKTAAEIHAPPEAKPAARKAGL